MDPIEVTRYGTVADLLSAIREERLLSQRELADLLGVKREQLCRYEKGHQEPNLATLRTMLEALGWSLLLSVEPSTARIDSTLAHPFDALDLLNLDVLRLLEVAALAYESGAGIVVGGEVAAVMQGVPVATKDMVIFVRPDDVALVGAAANEQHASVLEWDDHLAVHAGNAVARLVPSGVLPGNRIARVDFRSYFSGRAVPVADLAVLVDKGMLGPTATALVRRMRERDGC